MVSGTREPLHVVQIAALERDMRQSEQRSVAIERRDDVVGGAGDTVNRGDDDGVPAACEIRRGLGYIRVGRKVQIVGDDSTAVGTSLKSSDGELEEHNRGRVGDDDFARVGSDEVCDAAPDGVRKTPPAFGPGPDDPLTPLVVDDLPDVRCCRRGEAAKRVAVEIDEVGFDGGESAGEPT
jgi:hypothetical protein